MVTIPPEMQQMINQVSSASPKGDGTVAEACSQFLEDLPSPQDATERKGLGQLEDLIIWENEDGDMTIESRNIKNARFNLRRIFLSKHIPAAVLSWGEGIQFLHQHEYLFFAALAIVFLMSAKEIAVTAVTIDLLQDDIPVVFELYRLWNDDRRINHDTFLAHMTSRPFLGKRRLTKNEVMDSLDRLARIGAIGYVHGDTEIHLYERVVFMPAA